MWLVSLYGPVLLAAVAALLLVAVAGGVVALINQQRASNQARVALARQLGAQPVNEPQLDRAMLLAREAVNLDRSPQTEGTLLATLQRSAAVIQRPGRERPVQSAWSSTRVASARSTRARSVV